MSRREVQRSRHMGPSHNGLMEMKEVGRLAERPGLVCRGDNGPSHD